MPGLALQRMGVSERRQLAPTGIYGCAIEADPSPGHGLERLIELKLITNVSNDSG